MMKKDYIRDQVKQGSIKKLTSDTENLDCCRRIVEEIGRRNYSGLAAISTEYGISLSPLFRILETKAEEFLSVEQMPKSCEISALSLMLSSRADEMHLANLSGYKGLSEPDLIELYFLICRTQPGESETQRLNELIDTYEMNNFRDYIWDQGLHKFFNERYRSLKEVPETDLSVIRIAQELSLTAVFDEEAVVKRFIKEKMKNDLKTKDMKEELYQENTLKNVAVKKLEKVYEMFNNYPCDFNHLRSALLELYMDVEVARIEAGGISVLRDYIRSKSVIGAHEVAARYEFVCPGVTSEDMDRARRAINSSFLNQASKTKKGKVFLRREALYNLSTKVQSAECFRFSSGYLMCVVSTEDQGKYFIFGQYPSTHEQEAFILKCLGYFYLYESYQTAVLRLVRDYIAVLSKDIRMSNAIKKILVALPLGLSLAIMVGLLYIVVLGGIAESILVGSGILFVGVAISGKNGYDEDITPDSHEKIPDYVKRRFGQVVHGPEHQEDKPAESEKA